MKKFLFCTLSIMCLYNQSASAQTVYYPGHYAPSKEVYKNDTKIYFAIKGGVGQVNAKKVMPGEKDFEDYAPVVNIGIGTFFRNHFRAEAEYTGYFGASDENKETMADLGSGVESVKYKHDLQIHMMTANILVEYKSIPILYRPYLGIGIGAAYIDREEKYTALTSSNSRKKTDDEVAFAAVAKIGSLFPITEGFGVDITAQATYIATSDPTYIYTGLVGLRFSF